MVQLDVNALFRRAETGFQSGRFEAARTDLVTVLRIMGDHPQVLHLLALCETNLGRANAAADAFRRALKLAANDPQINNNYANLLNQQGDVAGAFRHFDRALVGNPKAVDPRYNRALLRQRQGDWAGARADLDQLVAAVPGDPRLWEARGTVNRDGGDLAAAAADYDRALALAPDRPIALHGAARVALERGDDAAVPAYRRALDHSAQDPALVLGLAEALEAAGQGGGIALLADQVARNPGWIDGQNSLARMRAESGTDGDFAEGFAKAVALTPADRGLQFAYWRSLALGGRQADALRALDQARPYLGDDAELAMLEAVFASESGDLDRADAAFARAGAGQDVDFARGRHALRRRDPGLAARLIEPLVRADIGMVSAWAHLSLAWRLADDPRHRWLCDQPGLYGTSDIGFSHTELDMLAATLRDLHRTRAHPIGQSLRGGTQTRGRLLTRPDPILVQLRERLAAAVGAHLDALPPADPTHPLLRFRGQPFGFAGSWSVRLSGGGFHVHHVHPEGVLSSACYVALPKLDKGDRPGWLEIGAPPAELGLDLAPLATIEPMLGRLALFPSYMFHGTRPFDEGERLTVAFDVVM
ncbi:MAG: tetratricopeptide repeat protein [Sphingomonas sp.]|uniref:tetratricopeptide repeat protein n=1 Tax=Sphingomonas sp. TaxID=28214 RepID=UPI0035A943F2|nr:tetratricopeptide repeat protein [Sphingomonas sp.]